MRQMRKIKIAVVDDHSLFRAGLIQILNLIEDFDVVMEANTGVEFLEKLATTSVDLVLLDIQMPKMDGIQVTKLLRQKHDSSPKVIILSMLDEDEFILHLLETGANGYLLKDSDPDDVEEAIRKVMDKGIYFTDLVSRVMLNKATSKEGNRTTNPFNYKANLSERELEILTCICQGLTTAEIANKICLSPRTVEGHRKRIMDKVKVSNTAALVAHAVKNKLISI
jgi:two-component system response regulator DegU